MAKTAKVTTTGRVPREVIDNQLLAALNDESKTAVVFERSDLRMVIGALTHMAKEHWEYQAKKDGEQMVRDLKKLHVSAWGSTQT